MEDLPVEILIHIFAFVDSKNRRKLFLVSKDFGVILDRYGYSKDVIPFVPLSEFLEQFKSDDIVFVVYAVNYNWGMWHEGLGGLAFAS